VAFPAIGSDIPSGLTDAGWREHLRRNPPPHWLYHLEVFRGPSARGRFRPARKPWLQQLAHHLRLPHADYEVEPRELVHSERSADEVSDVSFTLPLERDPDGWSYSLSVALGMVSAACSRPIPPWVVSSGSLSAPDGSLHLKSIGDVEKKIRLCLGHDPRYDVRPLIGRLYDVHPGAESIYGPRDRRTVSGAVKLLLIPPEVDDWSADLRQRLGVESCRAGLNNFGQADFDDLQEAVEELADGGMLVVQVRSVWQALHLLGFHHCHHPVRQALALPVDAGAMRTDYVI
jgi:hypothetical protein